MKRLFVLLQHLLPQHLLSRIVGAVANSQITFLKNSFIRIFVRAFKVDINEAASSNLDDYPTFNTFFTRALKPGIRPIEGRICSPADGTVSMVGPIDGNQIIQAKGVSYSLEKLLAGRRNPDFENGSFITIYLSPKDYHRVHTPITGSMNDSCYVPGDLFSVNQTTVLNVPDLFARNERLITWFDTNVGPMALIMVGAMIVAGIKSVWRDTTYPPRLSDVETFADPVQFEQGAELGHFEMGSTVILLFQDRLDFRVKAGDTVKQGELLVA